MIHHYSIPQREIREQGERLRAIHAEHLPVDRLNYDDLACRALVDKLERVAESCGGNRIERWKHFVELEHLDVEICSKSAAHLAEFRAAASVQRKQLMPMSLGFHAGRLVKGTLCFELHYRGTLEAEHRVGFAPRVAEAAYDDAEATLWKRDGFPDPAELSAFFEQIARGYGTPSWSRVEWTQIQDQDQGPDEGFLQRLKAGYVLHLALGGTRGRPTVYHWTLRCEDETDAVFAKLNFR